MFSDGRYLCQPSIAKPCLVCITTRARLLLNPDLFYFIILYQSIVDPSLSTSHSLLDTPRVGREVEGYSMIKRTNLQLRRLEAIAR